MEHLFLSYGSVLNILQDFCGRLTTGGVFIVIKRFRFCGSKTLSVPMDGWVLCFHLHLVSQLVTWKFCLSQSFNASSVRFDAHGNSLTSDYSVEVFIFNCDVSLHKMHTILDYYYYPFVLFFFLAWPAAALLFIVCKKQTCWASLCLKTHNPIRNWHRDVGLLPIKILQSVHWYNEQQQ